MIGYGPEEENFALELTYNYGIDGYKNGDDLQYICLQLDVEATKAKAEAEGDQKSHELEIRRIVGRGGGTVDSNSTSGYENQVRSEIFRSRTPK